MMTSTSPVKRPRTEPPPVFSTISSQKLLLSIPSLVLHPPTHKRHHQSVALAQNALRRCLKLQGLDPVDACRAWTGLAELGMGRLAIGIRNVEGEVEKALTKALLFANKVLFSPADLLRPFSIKCTESCTKTLCSPFDDPLCASCTILPEQPPVCTTHPPQACPLSHALQTPT